MKDLLKEGNVIVLGAGMKVYAMIPEMFAYENTKLSSELTETKVEIGQIFDNINTQDDDIEKTVHEIVVRIAEAFESQNLVLKSVIKASHFVRQNLPPLPQNKLTIPEGEYVVIKTSFGGGGIGHGPHDVYPDGHKVTCKKLDWNGEYEETAFEVSFYQSGSFSAEILPEELEVVRNMKLSYS
jgi:hypothetical protein